MIVSAGCFKPVLQTRAELSQKPKPAAQVACIPSGTNSTVLNSILATGGPNATVVLCPGGKYPLNNTLIFTDAYQSIITQGLPTDSKRAMLTVINPAMAVAVYGGCDRCVGIAIRNVQIDGARPALGHLDGGAALIEFGGNAPGQGVYNSHLFEPRGWSCLHFIGPSI